jgi:phosphoribosylanthranilate isomerase
MIIIHKIVHTMKLKICGYRKPLDRETLALIDYIGINYIPSSQRYIGDTPIEDLLWSLPSHIRTVSVWRDVPISEIIHTQEKYTYDYIQLHGNESAVYAQTLLDLWYRVIRAYSYRDIGKYQTYPCTYHLIDGIHPWSGQSHRYTDISMNHDFFLAWGISIKNIHEALSVPHVIVLDIASGIETDGHMDPAKIHELGQIIHNSVT